MDNTKVEVKNTKFGKGLFVNEKINVNEEIASFDGQTFYDNDSILDSINHAIQLADSVWRDSKGFARYANHSCDPNCGIIDNNKITAMRDINAGEEITWDYEMTEDQWTNNDNTPYFMDCKCGSKICRGKIGSYKNMPQEIRDKYKGFISQWLIDKYK